ncbi:hypothetical protein M3N55_00615 [Roseibaca sp. V10]|uniref:Uncharacterized protein n=1 Tax=Roseinatronobacter domitianus TaxID=2940293 RepID=A0ABT0LX88_9RHOB|nr:hypothetical protein [Roseibaca domitiana]MCL1627222.1 hypothetical protein [Roseibaca domitiana]
MTIIFDYIDHDTVISVSDRRVTSQYRVHSELFNKSIFCTTRSGFLHISFTGLAEIKGIQTDFWLASKILRRRLDPRVVLSTQRQEQISLLQSPNQVRNAIVRAIMHEASKNRILREHGVEIITSGLTLFRGSLKPDFLIIKTNKQGEFVFNKRLRPKRAPPNGYVLNASGGWDIKYPELWKKACCQIREIREAGLSSLRIVDVLVATLQAFSEKTPTIGGNAVATITRISERKTQVTYSEKYSTKKVDPIARILGAATPAFTPLFISPTSVKGPIAVTGAPLRTLLWRVAGEEHWAEIAPPPGGNYFWMGSYKR